MGEIADDTVNGDCCSWCGCYFKKGHGFPVVCKDCFYGWKRENKKLNSLKKLLGAFGLQLAFERKL